MKHGYVEGSWPNATTMESKNHLADVVIAGLVIYCLANLGPVLRLGPKDWGTDSGELPRGGSDGDRGGGPHEGGG